MNCGKNAARRHENASEGTTATLLDRREFELELASHPPPPPSWSQLASEIFLTTPRHAAIQRCEQCRPVCPLSPLRFCPIRQRKLNHLKTDLAPLWSVSARGEPSQTKALDLVAAQAANPKIAERERNRTPRTFSSSSASAQSATTPSSTIRDPVDVSLRPLTDGTAVSDTHISDKFRRPSSDLSAMDRGVKQEAFGADSYQRREDHVTPLKKESEPWRGSSGFGLANILNRSTPSSAMPKFSLPSLHSFGKPLVTKPEVSLAPQHYEEETQYVSARQQHQQLSSASSSPARQTSPSPNSRRIAPAPADEEDAEQEEESTAATTRGSSNGKSQSIRGGRWTADEHERFLEGFRIHGHKWKRVQQVVCSRSVTQVRTHAQKYLLKVAKLKAEKKQSGKSVDMVTLAAEQSNVAASTESVDGNDTAPSTPEQAGSNDSPRKTPRKKVRRLDHGNCDPVDQEYIAAAATTLCFLMSQKIDSLFDSRQEPKMEATNADFEPYDCYTQQPARQADAERSGSRKRSYMHFITEQQEDYSSSSYDPAHGEPSSYSIEGSKLCS